MSELARRTVFKALAGDTIMAPNEYSASCYRWVESGPRDENTAGMVAHKRVGHLFCGFLEGQEKALLFLEKELPRLAAELKIETVKVEDSDPRPLYQTSVNSALWAGLGKMQADRHLTFQRLLSRYHNFVWEGSQIVASFPNKKATVWTTLLIRASPLFIEHVEANSPFHTHLGKTATPGKAPPG